MTLRVLALILLCPTLAAAQLAGTWAAGLTLSATGEYEHAGQVYRSSSTLLARWTPPPDAVVWRYVLVLSETRSARTVDAALDATQALAVDLKAATTYTARLRACIDENCSQYLEAEETPQAATAEEYWRIKGTRRGYGSADRVVADGNVGSHAFKYGPWAGTTLDGTLQLYYNPIQREEKGVKVAEPAASPIASVDAAATFNGVSGYGLLRVCDAPQGGTPDAQCVASRSLAMNLALFQAVPLAREAGGKIRLYFEANGYDGRTRILHLDSQDGYIGRDFHAGPATRCSAIQDYSTGGGCEPVLDIGVAADGDRGYPGIESARQFKIALPTRDATVWDLSAGTFMWVTTEWSNKRCSDFGFNAAYAVWDGATWHVQDAGAGDSCPKLLKGVQAPAPVHLGGARYKLYFNRHRTPGGITNPQTATKPMQMLYADGERTGETGRVEFEDWEPLAVAREIHYVWADGSVLTEDEESKLDDYVMIAPLANDPAQLIMYSNMSSGAGQLPFIGAAVLINP